MKRDIFRYAESGRKKRSKTRYDLMATDVENLIELGMMNPIRADGLIEVIMNSFDAGFEAGCRSIQKGRCKK